MPTTPVVYHVFMDTRDVTPWVTSLDVSQPPRCLYRQFSLTFAGWSEIDTTASWDIFATYDPDIPRAECLIRAGIIPPDWAPAPSFGSGEMPQTTVTGYDKVWRIQRKAPRDTIVLAPGDDGPGIQQVIANYGEPIGRYRVWTGISTLHQALRALGNAAGIRVRCLLPDMDIQPVVVDPRSSYWGAMLTLLEPTAAEVWYRRINNELVITDPLAPRYGLGRRITIPQSFITSASGLPQRRRRVRRVIFRVPPC